MGYLEGLPKRPTDATNHKNKKKQTKEWERVTTAEEQDINDPSPDRLRNWIEEQNYRLATLKKQNNLSFRGRLPLEKGKVRDACWHN